MDRDEPARVTYDHSAQDYVRQVGSEISDRFESPLDRALLDLFASEVVESGAGPVIDLGCGPGRVTAYLAQRGVDVSGIDLSPQMVQAAGEAHPDLSFEVGSLTAIPAPDQSYGAAVLWYSIIHTTLEGLGEVWAELRRVLRPGSAVLIGFQAGHNTVVERANAYGSGATLTWHRHHVDDVVAAFVDAGFDIRWQIQRAPELGHEDTPQGFVLATR